MGSPQGDGARLSRAGGPGRVALAQALARHGVRTDKRLGQHFLVSEPVIAQIVSRVEGCLSVLEVGPGPGTLTAALSQQFKVVAVELDSRVVPVLRELAPAAEIVVGDALTTDLGELLRSLPEPRGLVSNMPYNITGPLLEAFTTVRRHYKVAVLMMQREVAERILAKPGDSRRGALSVAIQAQFEVRRVCLVPAGAFLPPPKVESAVLELTPKPMEAFVADVLGLVRVGFRQPRKTLVNNLSRLWPDAQARVEHAGLPTKVRPHELTWEQWQSLAS